MCHALVPIVADELASMCRLGSGRFDNPHSFTDLSPNEPDVVVDPNPILSTHAPSSLTHDLSSPIPDYVIREVTPNDSSSTLSPPLGVELGVGLINDLTMFEYIVSPNSSNEDSPNFSTDIVQ